MINVLVVIIGWVRCGDGGDQEPSLSTAKIGVLVARWSSSACSSSIRRQVLGRGGDGRRSSSCSSCPGSDMQPGQVDPLPPELEQDALRCSSSSTSSSATWAPGRRPESATLVSQVGTLFYFGFFLLMPWWSRLGKLPVPDRVTFLPTENPETRNKHEKIILPCLAALVSLAGAQGQRRRPPAWDKFPRRRPTTWRAAERRQAVRQLLPELPRPVHALQPAAATSV